MPVDLSFTSVVNAAGGALFLVTGIVILAIARTARFGRILGAFATVFGAHYVANNLYVYDPTDPLAAWVGMPIAAGTGILGVLLARECVRNARPSARRAVLALGVVAVLLYVAQFAAYLSSPEILATVGGSADDVLGMIYQATIFAGDIGILLVVAAGVQRVRAVPPDAPRERRAALLLTLAFGLYIILFIIAYSVRSYSPELKGGDLVNVLTYAGGFLAVASFVPLLGATPTEPHLARRALLALVAAGFGGILAYLAFTRYGVEPGVFGVARTIGVVLLAIAILRYDLLGVPLPRIVIKRGTLVASGLGALVIVAQVAQNVASPQYSLLMGGVASGVLVLAMERRRSVAAAAEPEVESAAILTYRAAVRAALADGVMTSEEEEHLAEVAHHLRLSPLDALRLRREVEDELARRART